MPANGSNNRGKGNRSKNRRPEGNRPTRSNLAVEPPADASPDRYAPTAWKSGRVELTLPSGQLCLVQRIPIARMAEDGIIDDFDSLSALVGEQHISKKSRSHGPPQRQASKMQMDLQVKKMLGDPEQFQKVLRTVDKVVMAVVVMPKIQPVPDDDEERDPHAAYIDWVADDDKGFVMQWAFGGTKDLERFRRELVELGDGMDALEDLEAETQRDLPA